MEPLLSAVKDDLLRDIFAAHHSRDNQRFLRKAELLSQLNQPRLSIINVNTGFSIVKHNGLQLPIMNANAYVNASRLLEIHNKNFTDWFSDKMTAALLGRICAEYDVNTDDLVDTVVGGNTALKGKYVHPALILYVAYWCKADLANDLLGWISQWKIYARLAVVPYAELLERIDTDLTKCKQWHIQLVYRLKLDADVVDWDLVTTRCIIVIDAYARWKAALGEILVNAKAYPDKQKCIYLFDIPVGTDISHVLSCYQDHSIQLKIIQLTEKLTNQTTVDMPL